MLGNEPVYRITGRDIATNLTHSFSFDADSLSSNFFGHPVAGATYFVAARSTGLGFWESAPYAVAGSVTWEYLSESQRPAVNDVLVTSIEGIALGEMLYRLSSLALDDSKSGLGRASREMLGFALAPPRGFERLIKGDAWADGAPPLKKHVRIAVHGGVDEVNAGSVPTSATKGPNAVVAVDTEYGDLLPAESKTTIAAYDAFDFYGAAVVSSKGVLGLELRSLAFLQGWSADVSSDEGPYRDNNMLGFVQSIDYESSNSLAFAAFGLGVGDVVVVRNGARERLRVGVDVQWSPLVGTASHVTPYEGVDVPRNYNFSTGPSVGLGLRLDMGPVGQLGLWAREYGTVVIDGVRGREAVGYARLWYEVDAVRDRFGVGLAPKMSHRAGTYAGHRTDAATQLSLELYAVVRL